MSLETVLFVVMVVVVVVLGTAFHLNYGALGLSAAFLLGTFLLGKTPSEVIALFPVSVFFNMMNATLFYGFGNENGALEKLAGLLVYKLQGVRRLMPLVIFLIAAVVSGLGTGGVAATMTVAPIAYAIQRKLGFKPIMAALPVHCGIYATSMVPWGLNYTWFTSWGAEYVGGAAAKNYGDMFFVYSLILFTVIDLFYFVLFRGWEITETETARLIEKPEPMTGKQKLTLAVILTVVSLIAIPGMIEVLFPNPVTGWLSDHFSLMPLCTFGTLLLTFLGAADFRTVVTKRVPWDLIFMVCGMGTFFSLAIDIGVVDEFTGMLSGISSPALVAVSMSLIGGILSCFLSSLIVLPVFFNMVTPLAASCGLPISALMCAGCMGLDSTSFSPFSQGGATQISFCPDEEERAKLTNIQLVVAVATLAMVCVFAAIVQFRIGAVY